MRDSETAKAAHRPHGGDPQTSDQLGGQVDQQHSPGLDDAQALPVVVARFWANRRGEAIFVQLREYEGRALVDVRKHYTAPDGTMQPTPKGLSIVVARLPDLAAAINKALRKARELGLVPDERP